MSLLFSACVFFAVLVAAASFLDRPAPADADGRPVVLVLVDGLSWEDVSDEPRMRRLFEDGASATVSTAQGATRPAEPRMGYVFIGAGARADTLVLPKTLPQDPSLVADSFTGAASSVSPGSFGEALSENDVRAAAVGENARLVVMDSEGEVPVSYSGENPVSRLEQAIKEDGAGFVAVEANSVETGGDLIETARDFRAGIAVASPNAPPGSPNLAPFAFSAGEDGGILYSPNTRTAGLMTNADVAPTLLSDTGISMDAQGRAASVRDGEYANSERLADRLAFVAGSRLIVWGVALAVFAFGAAFAFSRLGRNAVVPATLVFAAFPAGALLVAAIPVTGSSFTSALAPAFASIFVAFAIVGISCAFAIPAWRFFARSRYSGALAFVCFATVFLVVADAAAGGALMKYSTLGYSPFTGTRFYGLGNEYSAVLAGSITMGLGALAENHRRLPALPLALVGAVVVFVVALPTMGADVGGSAALGAGFAATLALVRRESLAKVAAWGAGGFAFAVVLFLASGALFPDVSHGSRAAGGGEGLYGILASKAAFAFSVLMEPALIAAFVALVALVFAGWRKARGGPLGAGISGAVLAALLSGAVNDSATIAVLFALVYPALASVGILFGGGKVRGSRVA